MSLGGKCHDHVWLAAEPSSRTAAIGSMPSKAFFQVGFQTPSQVLREAYVVELFPLVQSVDTVPMPNESTVLMLVQPIAADVFQVLTDERQTSSHDDRTQPNALSQVLTLIWGKVEQRRLPDICWTAKCFMRIRGSGCTERGLGGRSLTVLSPDDFSTVYGSPRYHGFYSTVCE